MDAAWKSEHGRPRPPAGNCDLAGGEEEDRLRLEVFRDNLRYIDAHNAEADAGLHGFRLGLTPFADLTVVEYRGRRGAPGREHPLPAPTRRPAPRRRRLAPARCRHRGQEPSAMRSVLRSINNFADEVELLEYFSSGSPASYLMISWP